MAGVSSADGASPKRILTKYKENYSYGEIKTAY